jgi:hypothetical protein
MTRLSRRRWIKTGLIFVPSSALLARNDLSDPSFLARLQPSAAASASPTDYGNLVAWWKADSFSLSDGTTIGDGTNDWIDQSSGGRTASQATSGARPTFKTNIFGSMPSVRFASGLWLKLSSTLSLTGDFTAFGVTKSVTLEWACMGMTAFNSNRMNIGYNPGGGTANDIAFLAPGKSIDNSAAFTTSAANARLNVWARNGNAAVFYENNGVSKAAVGYDESGTISLDQIGAYFGGSQTNACDLGELFVYSALRTQTEVQNLYTNYLKSRWGLP